MRIVYTFILIVPTAPQDLVVSERYQSSKPIGVLKCEWSAPKELRGLINIYQIVLRKIWLCNKTRCRREMPLGVDYYENITGFIPNKYHFTRKLDAYSIYGVKVRAATKAGWGPYSDMFQITTGEGSMTFSKLF